jgi:nucleotide-binding universal stress UspA family protein
MHEEGAFLVMGAYGRGAFSRLFRKSMANTIIREVRVPIFITHE